MSMMIWIECCMPQRRFFVPLSYAPKKGQTLHVNKYNMMGVSGKCSLTAASGIILFGSKWVIKIDDLFINIVE